MAQVVETTAQQPPLPGAIAPVVQAAAAVPLPVEEPEDLRQTIREWFQEFGYWYLTSALVHMILFLALGVIFMLIPQPSGPKNDAPSFEADRVDAETQADLSKKVEVGEAELENQPLTTELLLAPPPAQTAKYYDDSKDFTEAGGGSPTMPKIICSAASAVSVSKTLPAWGAKAASVPARVTAPKAAREGPKKASAPAAPDLAKQCSAPAEQKARNAR